MIRAVFFDIDGTLIPYDRVTVPESAKKAIKALHKKEIMTFICTGRPAADLRYLPLQELEIDCYIAAEGQFICSRDGSILREHVIPAQDAETLADWFRTSRYTVLLIERDRCYFNRFSSSAEGKASMIGVPKPQVEEYTGAPIYGAILFFEDGEAEPEPEELPGCMFRRWDRYAMDIVPAGTEKSEGLRAAMELYGLKREELMAFGDERNDASMLRFAGIGVAMGNGAEAAKQAADYVTEDVEHDGILRALEHFHII